MGLSAEIFPTQNNITLKKLKLILIPLTSVLIAGVIRPASYSSALAFVPK